MGDSSDSEEFFDAEEFTPVKGSKSSLCKNISVTEISNSVEAKDKTQSKTDNNVTATSTPVEPVLQDDRSTVKSVVQGRRRFQELRRCMQTEEEDEPDPGAPLSAPMEHPFKIISHDTMSLQSMTSLGRIGRILSGAADSHQNIRESILAPSASSREASTISDDPGVDRNQTIVLAMEPDVIASTKAGGAKQAGAVAAAPGAEPRPVAPPRRKKRNKLHGSQSLSTTDGDNLSMCTDTDDMRYVRDKPHVETLLVEPSLSNTTASQTMALPSPASTIESLTREFQDSLELSQSKYADLSSLSAHESRSERSHHSALDIKEAVKGEYVVKAHDEERWRSGSGASGGGAGGGGASAEGAPAGGGAGAPAGGRTHSEGRPPPTGASSLGSTSRRADGTRTRRRSAGDSPQGAPLNAQQLSDMEILEQVTVLNLDTGERVPLSVAEHKLPQCINPLSLHIMRLTAEYVARAPDAERARCGHLERCRAR